MTMKGLFVFLICIMPNLVYPNDFSGFFVGASINNDKNEFNLISKKVSGVPYGWEINSDDRDLSFKLNTGYNKIIDSKILLGIELGYNHSNNDQKKDGICITISEDCPITTFSYPVKFTNEKDLSIAGRFGYLITPKTLFYISGGYLKARIKAEYYNELGTSVTDTESDNLSGQRYGVGFEHFLWENLSLKGFFSQVNFKGENFLTHADSTYEVTTDFNTVDLDFQSLNIGINYHF